MSDVQQAVAMEYQRLIQYFSNSNQHPVSQQDAIESIKARKREIENTLRSNVIALQNINEQLQEIQTTPMMPLQEFQMAAPRASQRASQFDIESLGSDQ